MDSSPIVTVNLWFDRPVIDEPFVGLPGRTMQWVFDKRAGVRRRQRRYLSLVSSGASPLAATLERRARSPSRVQELLEAHSRQRGAATLLRASVVREPRATFSLAPGQPQRPARTPPIDGLFLAGDWIDTGLPATIESAVSSGHRAADAASDYLARRLSADSFMTST